MLVLLEDLHWIDPTTLELLDLVVDRLQRLPVLLSSPSGPSSAALDRPTHVTLLTAQPRSSRRDARRWSTR